MPASARKSLTEIRSDVCNTTLVVFTVIGVPGMGLSLLRLLDQGWTPSMGVELFVLGLLLTFTSLRRRIPYPVRANTVVAGLFALAWVGQVFIGIPTSFVYFIAASVMGSVFFGEVYGVAVVALASVVTASTYYMVTHGVIAAPDMPVNTMTLTRLASHIASIVVAAVGPLIAVSRFRAHLDLERRRAEAANDAKSNFLSMMSHELRTPLAGILGIADLLSSERLAPAHETMVGKITKSGRVLQGLLNDVLDFAKIEANQMAIERVPFNAAEVGEEIRGLFEPLAAEKGLTLSIADQLGPHARRKGDPTRLRQVIHNLVSNAIKFTERGSITVSLREDNAGGVLVVEVADTGIGLSAEQQARLYQPFVQAESWVSRQYGGTGLGLAITRRLVELMDGTIRLASRPGHGAVFTVILPCPREAAVLEAAPARAAATPARPLKLLIAEDNDTVRYLIETMLRKRGHTVTSVVNGREAYAAALAGPFDAIVMDMQMPEMDGPTATRMIRLSDSASADIPIVALTASVVLGQQEEYLAAGVDAVLGKPVQWPALFAALEDRATVAAPVVAQAADTVIDAPLLDSLAEAVGAEALRKMLGGAITEIEAHFTRLQAAVAEQDATRIKRTAHSIKGLGAQFGARKVSAAAKVIEDQGVETDDGRAALATLPDAFAAFTAAVREKMDLPATVAG